LRARTNNVEFCNDPCAQYEYGEAEDYTVIVTDEALSGTLMATLSDQSNGGPVSGAAVLLNGTAWYGITEEEGTCLIDNIAPGTYDILIIAEGFHDVNLESFTIAGNQMNYVTETMIPDLPENITLPDILIPNNESECYAATHTLTVGGSGSTFVVEAGGAAELVAGELVHLLPGTLVEHGGHLVARITTSGEYCSNQEALMANIADPAPIENPLAHCPEPSFFTIFPNPSTGRFTLELTGNPANAKVMVEASNLMGKQIFKKEYSGSMSYIIELENVKPGIYLIQVMRGNEFGAKKLIKK